ERSTDREPRDPRAWITERLDLDSLHGYRDRSIIDLGQVEPGQRAFELLHPTSVVQGTKVNHREAELSNQGTYFLFRIGIITRYKRNAATLAHTRSRLEFAHAQIVQSFYHASTRNQPLHDFTGHLALQVGDLHGRQKEVVRCINQNSVFPFIMKALEDFVDFGPRYGYQDDRSLRRFPDGTSGCAGPEFFDHIFQTFWSATITEPDLTPRAQGVTRKRQGDLACSENSDRHIFGLGIGVGLNFHDSWFPFSQL